jgi:hypothetical protein
MPLAGKARESPGKPVRRMPLAGRARRQRSYCNGQNARRKWRERSAVSWRGRRRLARGQALRKRTRLGGAPCACAATPRPWHGAAATAPRGPPEPRPAPAWPWPARRSMQPEVGGVEWGRGGWAAEPGRAYQQGCPSLQLQHAAASAALSPPHSPCSLLLGWRPSPAATQPALRHLQQPCTNTAVQLAGAGASQP